MKYLALALFPVVLAASPAAAAITTYEDFSGAAFAAAAGPTTLFHFNGAPGGSFDGSSYDGSSYDVGPFTLTGDATNGFGGMEVIAGHVDANVCGAATCGASFGYTIDFAAPITAFAATFFGAATNSSLTFTVDGISFAGPIYNYSFFGFVSDTAFSRITISGENELHQFDDVRFASAAAVPEPATWAMLIGGIGVTGGVLRRRAGRRMVAA